MGDEIQDVGAIDTSDERKAFDTHPKKETPTKEKEDEEEIKEEDKEDEQEDTEESEEEGQEDGEDSEEDDEDGESEDEDDTELSSDSLYQTLKKRDPKLLKEIPELRNVLFREQKFTEVFATIEDAKEAQEASNIFQKFNDDISSGNSETLIEALSKDKENLESFVGGFLDSVEKQSKELYLQTLYPEFKKMLRAALKDSNENIRKSAENINYFIFGDTNVASEIGTKKEKKDPKEDKLTERERAFEERQFSTFMKDVKDVTSKRVMRLISIPLEGTDMSPLLQKSLSQEIFSRVDKEIGSDARHMGNIRNLISQAKKEEYTSEGKDRIINAQLSRAKLLISKIRQQVLSEAKVSAKEISENKPKKKPIRVPSSSQSYSRSPGTKLDPKKVDWSKVDDERALYDGKVPMKG